MTNLFDLSDDVAVVIGATGVLGGAIAEGLAASGAKVAIIGRNAERGEGRVAAIKKAGGSAAFFSADALKREELHAVHEKIGRALGAPTILVNAAGGNDPKATVTVEQKFENIPTANWASVFDLNLVGGVFLPCQEFGAAMAQRGAGRSSILPAFLPTCRSHGW
jgi:NAD(P)-dependent dehydrogenase (short-subunit alcohol dehydrogenase family)